MPTDKALAVMTPAHLAWIDNETESARSSTCYSFPPYQDKCVERHHLIRDIESLVRYLVAHPERLAGEDEVVVKREEAIQVLQKLRGAINGDPTSGMDGQRIVMDWLALKRGGI